jgi:hypothetical protein
MLNVAVVAPAGIVTLSGTYAVRPVVQSSIDNPPVGAAAEIVTVPVEDEPPVTADGFTETEESVTFVVEAVMLSAAVFVTLPKLAVIVAAAVEDTDLVVIVKVAVVLPDDTVTDAGTVALALLLESATVAPPKGAALLSLTVPVTDGPPVTLAAPRVRDDRVADVAALTARVAVLLAPP